MGAEQYLRRELGGQPAMLLGDPAPLPMAAREAALANVLPALRGACASPSDHAAGGGYQRVVVDARCADDLAAFGMHARAKALCASNPITPDHVIRTKAHYLYLSPDDIQNPSRIRRLVGEYEVAYRRYYEASASRIASVPMHSPKPVVAVLAGVGVVAMHQDAKAARIAADIAEHTLRVKATGDALGDYIALSDDELAEMEYWPLETAKLGKQQPAELAGQVALVTGAAGAIGAGITEVLLERGACVFATDVDGDRLSKLPQRLSRFRAQLATHIADLTDAVAVQQLFAQCALRFGGVDCVVPNAGIAHVSAIEHLDHDAFARVMAVNTTATMLVLQAAVRMFRLQGTGCSVVLQASKNVFAPGAQFGAYSASKAAALQLGRIAAMEFAELSVRVNMVNADAVFGDDEIPSQLWAEVGPGRMQARGLDAQQLRDFYRDRSLLKQAVTPRHVGEAVAFFASMRTPTTGAVLPVDGGLPEAFPR